MEQKKGVKSAAATEELPVYSQEGRSLTGRVSGSVRGTVTQSQDEQSVHRIKMHNRAVKLYHYG